MIGFQICRNTNVLSNQSTEVTLYDNNGQKISSQKFTTNEFGSFAGTFTLPQNILTGSIRLANGTGDRYFRVEEYKRPKFEVSFDTLKKEYALNETVTVKGNANAYAGYTLNDAKVKYRVLRQVRWPYYWMYDMWRPMSPPVEIANGTATTDANGNFSISFPFLSFAVIVTTYHPLVFHIFSGSNTVPSSVVFTVLLYASIPSGHFL